MHDPYPRKISFVIPAYNEEQDLRALFEEISAVADEDRFRPEIIFVDDGSTDGTWSVITALAEEHPNVAGIRFRRNFGKSAALAAGFQTASAPLVFTLDADLQDDPHEIPNFLAKIDEGFDLVVGWKKHRRDPWHKTIPSKIFNLLVSSMTGPKLHDHNCGFKACRHALLNEIDLYGELHRFIPPLAHARGFRVAEIPVHHRRRLHGRSKYGVSRFIRGLLDLMTVWFLTRFGQRPSHLLGGVGLFGLAGWAAGVLALFADWLRGTPPAENVLLALCTGLAGLFAVQMISFGLLAELLLTRPAPDRQGYSIAERTPRPAPPEDTPEPVEDPASAVH